MPWFLRGQTQERQVQVRLHEVLKIMGPHSERHVLTLPLIDDWTKLDVCLRCSLFEQGHQIASQIAKTRRQIPPLVLIIPK